jgi:hypothetical protein
MGCAGSGWLDASDQLRQLDPARRAGLAQQVGHVGRHGLLAQHQVSRNLGVGLSADEMIDDLPLARGQARQGRGAGCSTQRRQVDPGIPTQGSELGQQRNGVQLLAEVVRAAR